ncbi:MAG: hypothetical protein Q7T96_00935 [Methylobacter sp.]|nr:hypothetical protein [Methylobacter sp.]
MLNQKQKSSGELIYQLTNARPSKKEWVDGKLVEIKKPAPVTVKATPQPDLSHLPVIERLTEARSLAAKHNLSAANPAPIAPAKPAKSWWPVDERTERIKAAVAQMEAATAAYNAE